jgi:hypothetical protein
MGKDEPMIRFLSLYFPDFDTTLCITLPFLFTYNNLIIYSNRLRRKLVSVTYSTSNHEIDICFAITSTLPP